MAIVGPGGIVVTVPTYPATHELQFTGTITDIVWRASSGADQFEVSEVTSFEGVTFAVGERISGALAYHAEGSPGRTLDASTTLYRQRVESAELGDGRQGFPTRDRFNESGNITVTNDGEPILGGLQDSLTVDFLARATRDQTAVSSSIRVTLKDKSAGSFADAAIPLAAEGAIFDPARDDVSGVFALTQIVGTTEASFFSVSGTIDGIDIVPTPLPPAALGFGVAVLALAAMRRHRARRG